MIISVNFLHFPRISIHKNTTKNMFSRIFSPCSDTVPILCRKPVPHPKSPWNPWAAPAVRGETRRNFLCEPRQLGRGRLRQSQDLLTMRTPGKTKVMDMIYVYIQDYTSVRQNNYSSIMFIYIYVGVCVYI